MTRSHNVPPRGSGNLCPSMQWLYLKMFHVFIWTWYQISRQDVVALIVAEPSCTEDIVLNGKGHSDEKEACGARGPLA